MSKIESLVEEMALPVCRECGVSLYDVEYKKEGSDYFLRIFIAKDGGVGIEDCENVSRALEERLDERDPIPEAYMLEVSSPGIERILRKDAHFDGAIGEEVEAKLFAPLDGKKVVTGVLEAHSADSITIKVGESSIPLPKEKCAQVKTVFHFGS